jgi:hypothetical protein
MRKEERGEFKRSENKYKERFGGRREASRGE